MKQTFLSNSRSLQHETPSPLPSLIQYAFYFHYFIFDFASQQPPTGKSATALPGLADLITGIC